MNPPEVSPGMKVKIVRLSLGFPAFDKRLLDTMEVLSEEPIFVTRIAPLDVSRAIEWFGPESTLFKGGI